ncbi:DUF862 domain-containing protein [Citrus sinensis]|uniref:DUF862 domain-containing protein n=1 Tax=Citrus sinensis TaxID=2711 RepID=A0ACB8MDD1_CITSI|nr:DUF862 domain-containing protein [Citrus sinensis]
MESGEHHQSVNIDRLADTLRGKFRSLHRLPQKCCIYRVPQQIRGLNPKAHTPQLVSIGPFHHGDNEELRATEEIKIRYLEYFLQRTEPRSCRAQNKLRTETQNIPTATQLHQAGVKFQLGSSTNLFDITFNVEGILEIPLLRISESTEILFRNLQAFERLHCGTRYINDYVIIMNYLVNTAHDVDLLVQNRVIENWLWNSEAVSNLFHNLVQETSLSAKNFQYTDLVEDLRAYCRYRWHRWKAMLRQDYFNSPWASISVIAAVILLLLTLIQAICSIIAL